MPDEEASIESEPTAVDAVDEASLSTVDPRTLLATWANDNDEWVRAIIGEVIQSGAQLTDVQVDSAYQLFRQEKGLDERVLDTVAPLATDAADEVATPPLSIIRVRDVQGVNALASGSVIEPHEGLTILYGENGTGKTGYARIFKALAGSRTDAEILGNIAAETAGSPSARIDYRTGSDEAHLNWKGEHSLPPFTRMSIFDSPSVSYHVDDALEYVYVPAALALFNHVSAAIRGVQTAVDDRLAELQTGSSTLLGRFPRESSIYAQIETLGASTNLDELKAKANSDPKVDEAIETLRRIVAALEADTVRTLIASRQREKRILEQAFEMATGLMAFDVPGYNELLANRAQLAADYESFRSELFAAADLPAPPEETWSAFIEAGEAYRKHLVEIGAHDADRCLYCRQGLDDPARALLTKYSVYLEDKISTDLREVNRKLRSQAESIRALSRPEVRSYLTDYEAAEGKPAVFDALSIVDDTRQAVFDAMTTPESWEGDARAALTAAAAALADALASTTGHLTELQAQAADQATALKEKRAELNELIAAAEIARSWTAIESQVMNAKEADQLTRLKGRFRGLLRGVTELSKEASDQLINQNFDTLFAEECDALRAPTLKVQFVGREGRPQRRKLLSSEHKPSLVLSEGEQKVLAMADFLAEARLAGITAPVVFDDPVNSLDHRRIDEVARRISMLADASQVIVFTHDIFFATTLLALFESSKRCSYFQITDEGGKGRVTKATHPRWDTLNRIRAEINKTIEAAEKSEGEARAALVRTGYDWIRAWCEVFTEIELLKGVTQRYQPNVGMTKLSKINTEKLPELISTVTKVFDDACRFIDGHSQPLPSLGVAPTLERLKADWARLQECKTLNDKG